jgi:type II secretory ATPase GspE/PulE/Tfp pilus assembly ATPase PilB-like protein
MSKPATAQPSASPSGQPLDAGKPEAANSAPKKLLGERLVESGLISADQLKIALIEQKRRGKLLGEVLVSLGFVTEETFRDALSERLGAHGAQLQGLVADRAALALLPKELARRYQLFPVSLDDDRKELHVATADPNDVVAIDQLNRELAGRAKPILQLASVGEIQRAIELYYGYELSIDGILHEIETGKVDVNTLNVEQGREYTHPVVRLIDALLTDSVLVGASDIHFEPEAQFIRIRYRVDGVLRQVRVLHRRYWPAMLVRLKILSGMNIAESRAPQDGRISLVLAAREIDFRASAHPTIHGENFVVRILDRKRGLVPLDGLGLDGDALATLKLMLARPEGLMLITGPTGSGKTTTLYSVLGHKNSEQVNIMTLEDPVEYTLPLVRQTSIASTAKMTFGEGVRSLMRQDPDIVLVGEVRDKDTAEMALRAAMTGHQVFSTLHSNSALRSIPRLFDLGVRTEVLAGNLIGIVGQRLVRRLCTECRIESEPDELEQRLLGCNAGTVLHRALGCENCHFTGYKGRVALIEIVRWTRELDELLSTGATLGDLHRSAKAQGYVELADIAIRRILDGVTTLEEAARVVDLTERVRA